jgi:hypothetical protein
MIAANTAARVVPTVKLTVASKASSARGASRMTPIAANMMALAPFGHSVTIQKSSAAPITTKARPALTSEGSQSGTRG